LAVGEKNGSRNGLTPREREVMNYVRSVRFASCSDVVEATGIPLRTVESAVAKLVRLERLRVHFVEGTRGFAYSAVDSEMDGVYIRPLRWLRELHERPWGAFDVETKDGVLGCEIFCWGLAVGSSPDDLTVVQGRDADLTEMVEALDAAVPEDGKRLPVYVHNLSFDVRHVMAHLQREGERCTMIGTSKIAALSVENRAWFLVDSLQFLQASQEAAEIEFGVPDELRKIDCKTIFEKPFDEWTRAEKRQVLKHNKNDVKALWHIILEFRRATHEVVGRDALDYMTPASLAVAAWRTTLEEPVLNPLVRLVRGDGVWHLERCGEREAFARKSYYGGRTEVFWRGQVPWPVATIDVNSMYPSVMKLRAFPVGRCWWVRGDEAEDALDDETLEGCAEADVVPPRGLLYPLLPTRVGGRLSFRLAKAHGVWTMPELRRAREVGYEVRVSRALVSNGSGDLFTSYVERLYEVKRTAAGWRRRAAKLLMNSLYGKFGERALRDRPEYALFPEPSSAFDFIDTLPPDASESAVVVGTPPIVIYKKASERVKAYQNVLWASYTTAYGRLLLFDVLLRLQHLGIPAVSVRRAAPPSTPWDSGRVLRHGLGYHPERRPRPRAGPARERPRTVVGRADG